MRTAGWVNSKTFSGEPGLMDRRRFVRPDDLDLLDAGGEDMIAEFQEQPAAGHEVGLDGAAPPGAPIDRGGSGGGARAIEPAPGDAVAAVAQTEDGVGGVAGTDHDQVTALQVGLLDPLQTLHLPDQVG